MPMESPTLHMEEEDFSNGKDYTVCDQCRLRKIRCGRQRPNCLNCTRHGRECIWSGRGKKPSQTLLLSNVVMELEARLEQLENIVRGARSPLSSLNSESSHELPHSWRHLEPTIPNKTHKQVYSSTPPIPRNFGHLASNLQIAQQLGGHGCHLGQTCLASFMHDMNKNVLSPLCVTEAEILHASGSYAAASEKINHLVNIEEHLDLIQDGSPPTSPPQLMLEAVMDPYFDNINPSFPIWKKEEFRLLVKTSQESEHVVQDRAYNVSCNNLILLTLGPRSLQSCAMNNFASDPRQKADSIDLDITKSLVSNAKRSITNIELLLSPRLLNLQALLSLSLVAQQYLSPGFFSFFFNLAAQVARSLGLSNWDSLDRHFNPSRESQTRQNLLFCMYTLDKALCWMMGLSPGIQMPKTDFLVGPVDLQDELISPLAARVKLAAIEERIFTELYSEKPGLCTDTQFLLHFRRSHQKLEIWWNESGATLDGPHDFNSFISASQSELIISFHSTRMLVNWPAREELDASVQILDDARTCLRLFLQLWNNTSQVGTYSTLTRLISCYPPVGFCRLLAHVLTSHAEHTDAELLQSFTAILQTISGFCEEDSYCVRLCKFAEIIMDLINPPWNQQPWGQFESTSLEMQWKPSTIPVSGKDNGTGIQRTPRKIDDAIADGGSEVRPMGSPSTHFALASPFGGYPSDQSVTSVEMSSNYLRFDANLNNSLDHFSV